MARISTTRRNAGDILLLPAVESNNVNRVKYLLAHGADVNVANIEGTTPLHLACSHENTRMLYGSHKHYDADKNDVHWLPTRTKHIEIVQLLVNHGANVNARDLSGDTPLMTNCEMPSILHSNGFWADNSEWVDDMEEELLYRRKTILNILLDHGADINTRNQNHHYTILHVLAGEHKKCSTNTQLAEVALEKGAIVDAVDAEGSTPLHVAVNESKRWDSGTDMIEMLLDYGANINARNRHLNTPLHEAIVDYDSGFATYEICKTLLEYPLVDVNAQNKSKKTPLHMAITAHSEFCVEIFLEFGADINLEDKDGHPPIYYLLEYVNGTSGTLKNKKDLKIITFVVAHVKILMKLKYPVTDKVISHLNSLSSNSSLQSLASVDVEIEKEIEQMKNHKLDDQTSLYDILSKNANDMSKCVVNENLQAVVVSIAKRESYKYFGNFIKRQYRIGIKRFEVLEPARKALNLVTKRSWSDTCSEKILSNLCDEDLEKFMSSMSNHGICKRSTEDFPRIPSRCTIYYDEP